MQRFHYMIRQDYRSKAVSFYAETLADALEQAKDRMGWTDPQWTGSVLCCGGSCPCPKEEAA
jgi:hypothetical protein